VSFQVVGEYHLGDMVNRFQHGSLVMQLPDNETAQIPTLLFGTILGIIGVIASIPREQYEFLARLQVLQSLLALHSYNNTCFRWFWQCLLHANSLEAWCT
jgi:hypothetical protein